MSAFANYKVGHTVVCFMTNRGSSASKDISSIHEVHSLRYWFTGRDEDRAGDAWRLSLKVSARWKRMSS